MYYKEFPPKKKKIDIKSVYLLLANKKKSNLRGETIKKEEGKSKVKWRLIGSVSSILAE
jgi:hypothetical protein